VRRLRSEGFRWFLQVGVSSWLRYRATLSSIRASRRSIFARVFRLGVVKIGVAQTSLLPKVNGETSAHRIVDEQRTLP